MKYRDLKQERDDAIARAIEAERNSRLEELDRVRAEFDRDRAALNARIEELEQEVRAERTRFIGAAEHIVRFLEERIRP